MNTSTPPKKPRPIKEWITLALTAIFVISGSVGYLWVTFEEFHAIYRRFTRIPTEPTKPTKPPRAIPWPDGFKANDSLDDVRRTLKSRGHKPTWKRTHEQLGLEELSALDFDFAGAKGIARFRFFNDRLERIRFYINNESDKIHPELFRLMETYGMYKMDNNGAYWEWKDELTNSMIRSTALGLKIKMEEYDDK